jgi:hypothetical protein
VTGTGLDQPDRSVPDPCDDSYATIAKRRTGRTLFAKYDG